MNIFTVTPGDLRSFKTMFADFGNVECLPVNPKSWPSKIDLLIFTGGEDVTPSIYGGTNKGISYNMERDNYERFIYSKVSDIGSPVNKILGICRGVQFLNVMMGGSLVRDIEHYYGKPHDNIHDLKWMTSTIFTEHLPRVNSLHHQCIYNIGNNGSHNILAIEPNTRTIEAILWENRVLGFQFHPEYFANAMKESRDAVASGIVDWVNGKSIYEKKSSAEKITTRPEGISYEFYKTIKADWS